MALSWLMACKGCVTPNNRDSPYSMHSASSIYKTSANSSASSLASTDSTETGIGSSGLVGGNGGLLSSSWRPSSASLHCQVNTLGNAETSGTYQAAQQPLLQQSEAVSPLFSHRADDFVQVDMSTRCSPAHVDLDDYVLL